MKVISTGGLAPVFKDSYRPVRAIEPDRCFSACWRFGVVTAMIVPSSDELLFLALGGAGEIGMNLNLYGHAGKWLMVDLGIAFGDEFDAWRRRDHARSDLHRRAARRPDGHRADACP